MHDVSGEVLAPPHLRLAALINQACGVARQRRIRIGLVYPCDVLAMQAAVRILDSDLARPVLIGPQALIRQAAHAAQVDVRRFELLDAPADEAQTAREAVALARQGALEALMKGSLHSDALMSAVVSKQAGLRTARRISHAFVFDLPRYKKLLALADCVVNIAPDLPTKCDILSNALDLLRVLDINKPKVGIVAAVESVNPSIPATLDAQALVKKAAANEWPGAIVEGPFGFDNAISAESARIKKINTRVAGDPDLLLMPDLNAGNILYKSFNYIGGGDCAGLVLGATVPVVLTSRADSVTARLASVALAVLKVSAPAAQLQ